MKEVSCEKALKWKRKEDDLNEKTDEEKMGAQTSLGFPRPAINWTAIFEPITVHLRKKRGKQERNGRERGKDEGKEGTGFKGIICLWHSAIWLLLFSADERKSYGFKTTWVMTEFLFFLLNYPFKGSKRKTMEQVEDWQTSTMLI